MNTHNTFPLGRWTTKPQAQPQPLIDHADQSALLKAPPLAGLFAQHEDGGRYVLLAPVPGNPNSFQVVAENLSQMHALEIVKAFQRTDAKEH